MANGFGVNSGRCGAPPFLYRFPRCTSSNTENPLPFLFSGFFNPSVAPFDFSPFAFYPLFLQSISRPDTHARPPFWSCFFLYQRVFRYCCTYTIFLLTRIQAIQTRHCCCCSHRNEEVYPREKAVNGSTRGIFFISMGIWWIIQTFHTDLVTTAVLFMNGWFDEGFVCLLLFCFGLAVISPFFEDWCRRPLSPSSARFFHYVSPSGRCNKPVQTSWRNLKFRSLEEFDELSRTHCSWVTFPGLKRKTHIHKSRSSFLEC